MVLLHVKKGDDDLFLYECSATIPLPALTTEIAKIHNARQKIFRMCAEIEYLADHGIHLPPNMVGLLAEQLSDLKLTDGGQSTFIPSGGSLIHPDPYLKRNGHAPNESMTKILKTTAEEAKSTLHKNLIQLGTALTYAVVHEQFLKLKGALTIVYPMGLPLYDPLHIESTTMEAVDLDCGYGSYRDVVAPEKAALWWAGKELKGNDKLLRDYIGPNEKTRIVIKLTHKESGAPGREPVFTDEQRKDMMAQAFRRQQEIERLLEDDDDHYLNSQWADGSALKRSFQGINNIKFRPV